MSDLSELLRSDDVRDQYVKLPADYRAAFEWRSKWMMTAHDHQIVPAGDWWAIWLLQAGRGAGKTRTAAEQVGWWAWQQPKTRWLVAAPTSSDVRGTCFEGDSGLVNVIPPLLVKDYNKSLHEMTLINGSLIKGIPASEPERFRGAQWHGAWCDELAAWDYLQDAWDQIMLSVRLGKQTRIICTTTPKPKDLLIELNGREGDDVVITRASTHSNLMNLSPTFQKQIMQYEGTKLGRQEIYAEIIDPEESGIVKRDWFKLWPPEKPLPKFEYILQSYDCATSEKTANDPTACITWGVFKPLDSPMSVMMIDCWQDRLQYPDLRPKVIDEYKNVYGTEEGKSIGGKKVDLILIEDKSAGISLIQDLQRAYLPVQAYNPGRADKNQRLSIVAPIIKSGRVWIPESSSRKGYVRDWAEGCISQICAFPDTTHDDFCVDAESFITMSDGTKKRIKDVLVGDMVLTPAGGRKVLAIHDNGIKNVWQMESTESKLIATPNHKIFTNDGWISIDTLNQGVHNVYLNVAQDVRLPNHLSASVERVINTHTMRPVFDLTVEGEHCYYANGFLVHNCDAASQGLRYLRDGGWLDIDPEPRYDDEDYLDETRQSRGNPYAQ